ncbi:MAG: DUF927 domain-containing protein [Methylocella sp.]
MVSRGAFCWNGMTTMVGDTVCHCRAPRWREMERKPAGLCRERLTAFLVAVRSPARVTATSRVGWHGSAFVLPDQCIGALHGEDLLLQGSGAIEHAFRERGTLEEWQNQIARYAVGNSRLGVALPAAFAAALVGRSRAAVCISVARLQSARSPRWW